MARRKSAKPPAEPISITEIPLTVPDRTRRPPSSTGGKTLLDLIDERRAELGLLPDDNGKQTGSSKASPPLGKAVRIDGKDDSEVEEITNDELFGPVMQTVFYTVPLLTVLFCLDVLVYKQYRQEIIWEEIARRIAKSGPVVFLIHYLVHPHRNRWLVQAGLLILSVACGCYIVDSVNRAGYYAVMKKTPPLGTLWVWAVVEMDVWLDVLSCAIVGIFTWWGEYNVL